MQEKETIALDFDGCIALGDTVKMKYAKLLHNIDISPAQTLKQTYPLGEKKYVELVQYINIDYILEYKLDPTCIPVLKKLSEDCFRFVILSSRTKKEIDAVKKFVEHHRLPIEELHATLLEPKRQKCLEIGAKAIVEDCLYKLEPLENDPIELFFFRRPWNAHEKVKEGSRVKEISHWDEFTEAMVRL